MAMRLFRCRIQEESRYVACGIQDTNKWSVGQQMFEVEGTGLCPQRGSGGYRDNVRKTCKDRFSWLSTLAKSKQSKR